MNVLSSFVHSFAIFDSVHEKRAAENLAKNEAPFYAQCKTNSAGQVPKRAKYATPLCAFTYSVC